MEKVLLVPLRVVQWGGMLPVQAAGPLMEIRYCSPGIIAEPLASAWPIVQLKLPVLAMFWAMTLGAGLASMHGGEAVRQAGSGRIRLMLTILGEVLAVQLIL